MEWGTIIRRVRESKGLTQENIADELGVNKTTIIRWEQESNIKTPALEKLAKAFGMDIGDLYAYHNNPSMLEDPIGYYKIKKKVSVLVELDGSLATLDQWLATLKKLNTAID
jgi:transcriptional regulator with XRE-family HTH domain